MLIDLKAHYLDLVVLMIEKAGHAALHVPIDERHGLIYVTPTKTKTNAIMVLAYNFDTDSSHFTIEFGDGRDPVNVKRRFVEGLDPFITVLSKSLLGNRLEYKAA